MTVSLLIHTIANLNADFVFSELPVLYDIAFEKMKKVDKWDKNALENLKLIWNAMAITKKYHMKIIVNILFSFIAKNL